MNKLTKVVGYEIGIQKSVLFLHTNIKLSESKINKVTVFIIVSTTIKYLGKDLTWRSKTYAVKTLGR